MTRIDLPQHDIVGIRAPNPGPFTLTGTNTWIVGREPTWVVDPGPELAEHVQAIADEIRARGGLGGIALTHHHADHAQAVAAVRREFPDARVGAAGGSAEPDVPLSENVRFGPLLTVELPGHTRDHLAFVAGRAVMTGDAVLGSGSVFLWPDPGALTGYLAALERLKRHDLAVLCPGHGPLVHDPTAKLDEYIEHRLDRERRLIAALDAGLRTVDELLDTAWSDAPAALRPAATVTLATHLDKLADEGRLPPGVERPEIPTLLQRAASGQAP
jgi:glyoxylase-like metal-dependent hydrolase (beta-lactamase superfamily II)